MMVSKFDFHDNAPGKTKVGRKRKYSDAEAKKQIKANKAKYEKAHFRIQVAKELLPRLDAVPGNNNPEKLVNLLEFWEKYCRECDNTHSDTTACTDSVSSVSSLPSHEVENESRSPSESIPTLPSIIELKKEIL